MQPFINDNKQPEALKYGFRNLMEPLLVLFNKAAHQIFPFRKYYMAYSIPGGVYGYFSDFSPTDEQLNAIARLIRQMLLATPPIHTEILNGEEIMAYFSKTTRTDIMDLLKSGHPKEQLPEGLRLARVNGFSELLLNDIRVDYSKLHDFRLFRHNKGFLLIADSDFFKRVMPQRIEQSKYFKRFEESEEAMKHFGISSFGELNQAISRGALPEFIKIAEVYHSRRLARIADNILAHPLKPRVIFLAGPTSSGKTTSANRLAIELKVLKKNVLVLSLDNYYLPHNQIPDDPETGMKNFELITALDLALFIDNVHDLIAGKPVRLPRYHFDGKGPVAERDFTQVGPDTMIIVEGIHGLNPLLWQQLMDMESYRLYVSALTTLNIHDHLPFSTSDHRLIRRLVRDFLFRGYDINETILRWPDVMQNEYKSIFPFQERAHAIFNSALIYEIAVFAYYAGRILDPDVAINDQVREEVLRLRRILDLLIPINPTDIPPTSVLREFIGGSSFTY